MYLGSRASHKLHLSLAIMSCHEGLIVAIASLLSMTLRRTVAVGLGTAAHMRKTLTLIRGNAPSWGKVLTLAGM